MSETKTVLLKVELDTADLKKNAIEAEKQLEKLVPALKKIKDEQGTNTLEYKKAQAEVKAYNKVLTDTAKAIEINERVNKNQTGSIAEMRDQLSASTIAWKNLSKQNLENTDEGKRLQQQVRDLSDALKEQESAVGDNRRNVGNYAEGIAGLKKELKDLKSQMVGLDAGSEEYQQASERAGELGDKIKEVNENVKASSGGTGFEKMSNNLGLIKGDLENMDFAGVSEKMKQMAVISKSMTFGEVVGGLKNMGSALVSLGKAILMNPLFLMVGAIVAVVGALKMWNDSVEEEAVRAQEAHTKSIENNIKSMERQADISKRLNEAKIRDAELNNASEKELSKLRLKSLDDDYNNQLSIIKKKQEHIKSLHSENKKATSEDRRKELNDQITDEYEALKDLTTNYKFYSIEREALVKENNAKILAEEKDGAEKRKAQHEKELQDRLAIERRLNDLILQGKELSYEQEKQQLDAKYVFLQDTAKDNAQELLDIEEMKNIEFQKLNDTHRQLEIDAVTEDYRRQIEDAKTSKKERELLIQNRNKAISIIEDKYRIDSKKSETDLANFRIETQKKLEKEKLDSEQRIAILQAEINLEKAKGTSQEFSAWASLQQEKFRILEDNYNRDLELYKNNTAKKEEVEKQFQKDSLEYQNTSFTQQSKKSEEQTEKTKEQKKSEILAIVNATQQLTDSLFQIQQNQIQAELNKDQDKYNEKQKLLQQQLDAGIISQAEFNAQKSKLDSDYAKQESKLKEEQFKKNKQAQIIQATINTAVGVANALTAVPFSLPLSVLAGALGALQIATIVAQPTPKFNKGGVFGGKPHSDGGTKGYFDDGTQIEVEKDEAFFILNKRSSAMINQLSNLNELGGGVSFFKNGGGVKFAQGGAVGTGISTSIDNRFEMQNQLVRAFQFMPNPVVAVQDINDGVRNYVNLVNRAEF
jgi:hypothetical protein